MEYEQLKNMVRECEERLRQLREEEARYVSELESYLEAVLAAIFEGKYVKT